METNFAAKMSEFPKYIYIIFLFLSTRIILTLIGILSRVLLEPYHSKEYHWFIENLWNHSDQSWLSIWSIWDSYSYLGIASKGYVVPNETWYVFLPVYPMLIKLIGAIIHNGYLAGIIISSASLLIACVYLYKLVEIDEPKETALRSVKYLFLFPTAFIFSGIFTESTFVALAVACFYYARKGNWFLVGILGIFLSLTRVIGVLIFLPLLCEYLKSKSIDKDILYLALIPAGIIIWMIFNYHLTGDFLAFVHAESTGWGRAWTNPFLAIYNGLISHDSNLFFMALFSTVSLLILIIFINKIRMSYWIFGICSLVTPLFFGLISMPRLALVAFPLFIIFAKLTKDDKIDDALTIFLALLQGCLMVLWSNGFTLII